MLNRIPMRYLYLTFLLGMAVLPVFSQTPAPLSAADKLEIKAEAKKVIETHLSDLLNSVTSDAIGDQGKKLIIYNSFLSSESQIFETNAIIEDDTSPEYTTTKKGYSDLKVQNYLEKLALIYTKSSNNSIKISEVNVTDVKQGAEYPYVLVHFKTQFMNKHRNKPDLPYAPIIRTAEFRATKVDKQWQVLMTGIRYFKQAPAEQVIVETASNAQVKEVKNSNVIEPKEKATVAVAKKEEQPKKPETKAAEKPEPVVKTQESVRTTQNEMKKVAEEPVKPAEKSPELVPANPPKTSVASAPNSEAMKQLETKAAKYKTKTNIFRAGAGAAVVGAAATFFIVNSSYSDYKSKLNKSNSELETWWNDNENNFGSIENYKAKPKSLIEFGSPGIYAAGAGLIAGGVLWFLSSGSNRQVKQYRKELEEKRKQLSITPQVSGSQRYAGLYIRYKF